MNICVNGEVCDLEPGTTVEGLLDSLGVNRRHVAVEVNEQLVPRAEQAAKILEAGDRLEVVTLVGGG